MESKGPEKQGQVLCQIPCRLSGVGTTIPATGLAKPSSEMRQRIQFKPASCKTPRLELHSLRWDGAMKSQSLFHEDGLIERTVDSGSGGWNASFVSGKPASAQLSPDPTERKAKWQKHVVVALWVCLALLIAISGALVYAKAHGLFESSPGHTPALPPWPTGS